MQHNPSEIVPFSFEFKLSEKEKACVGVEKPGGWKPTLFVDAAAAIKLRCSLCNLVCRDACQASCCGSLICASCLKRFLMKNETTPPCFGKCLRTGEVFPDTRSRQEIATMNVRCPGCSFTGILADLKQHKCHTANRPHHYGPRLSKDRQLDIVEEALAAPQLISSTAQKHKIPRQTVQTWVSQARATRTQLLKSELLDHGHSGALFRQKQPQRSGRQPDVAREQAAVLAQEVIRRRNQNLSTSSRWFRRVAGIKRTKGGKHQQRSASKIVAAKSGIFTWFVDIFFSRHWFMHD